MTAPFRQINAAGLALIKSFEGCKLRAYEDSGGVWSIGHGHTRNVYPGQTCTQLRADEWLGEDLAAVYGVIDRAVTAPLNDNQYSALCSFVFNVGPGRAGVKSGFVTLKNGQPSTMLRLINAGRLDLGAAQMLFWCLCDGIKVAGLLRRRQAELALWRTPIASNT